MFPADGLNREGDMSTLEDAFAADKRKEQLDNRNAIPFCPGCRKYHREGHQFCENYGQLDLVGTDSSQISAKIAILRMTILEEREKEYGSFSEVAAQAIYFKQVMHGSKAYLHDKLSPVQKEALDLICTKLARISNNPNHQDSWLDIIGYCNLVLETLPKTISK